MKVDVEKIDETQGITNHVSGGGTAGLPYETIQDLKGVKELDRLDKDHALVLLQSDTGALALKSIQLP